MGVMIQKDKSGNVITHSANVSKTTQPVEKREKAEVQECSLLKREKTQSMRMIGRKAEQTQR